MSVSFGTVFGSLLVVVAALAGAAFGSRRAWKRRALAENGRADRLAQAQADAVFQTVALMEEATRKDGEIFRLRQQIQRMSDTR